MTSDRERKKKRYAEDPDYRRNTLAYNRNYYAANKDDINAQRRRKRAEDPQSNREQRDYRCRTGRKDWLKYYYGLSVDEYNAMVARQNGACAICKEKPAGPLCVDHCHVCGAVRGLLCRRCNLGIGHLKDDPRLLEAALAYLEGFVRAKRGRRGRDPPHVTASAPPCQRCSAATPRSARRCG